MGIKVTEKSINDLIGPPTDISSIGTDPKKSVSEIAFDLYRETAIVAIVSSHLYESYDPIKGALPRDQAIEAGLLIRIIKFMASVLALLCDKTREHGEVIMALNRCITESAINLRFFCEKATQQDFDEFVKSSLKPEKETYTIIQENVSKRGEALPIETRMINSINRVFRNSGVTGVNELNSIPKRKGYKSILKTMGMESDYPMLQGVPSHAIHGTWVDLMLHHLEEVDSGFRPKPDPTRPDARLICPINMIVLTAVKSYVDKRFPRGHEGISTLLARIDDLIERNIKIDALHEERFSKIHDSK